MGNEQELNHSFLLKERSVSCFSYSGEMWQRLTARPVGRLVSAKQSYAQLNHCNQNANLPKYTEYMHINALKTEMQGVDIF